MYSLTKRTRVLLAAAISTAAIFAFSVGASSAAAANAWWVNPGKISLSGSITLKLNGGSEKTCTASSGLIGGEGTNTESGGQKVGSLLAGSPNIWGLSYLAEIPCTGSTKLQVQLLGYTTYESGFYFNNELGAEWSSPYGAWYQLAWKLPFTNAASGKPSFVTFSNTKIGETAATRLPITATGTLNVTRSNGENITLTH